MKPFLISALVVATSATVALASHNIVIESSPHDVPTTLERLVSVLEARGMTIFDRIDHAAAARRAGFELRPTTVIIFGNPRVGTALMQCNQNVGLDLPLKALVREDADGRTWVSYSHPDFLADRYGLFQCRDQLLKMESALKEIIREATAE